ncbi:acyltransferase family protein [Gottfriedia sp. NPDC057991]|uniref:acyltransferase family protein n=1 Tax=Gottfriedia sp. NPDC057991 TaxID=3346298 RepID=UPI0036D9218C
MNYSLNTFRAIAALFVVLIHVSAIYFELGYNDFLNYFIYRNLFEIAVPIFFAATGYLLNDKIHYYKEQMIDYNVVEFRKISSKLAFDMAKKYLFYYLFVSIIYIVFEYYLYLTDRLYLDLDRWNIFLERLSIERFLNGTIGGVHLWFLTGLVVVLLILGFLLRLGVTPGVIFVIVLPLYLLNLEEYWTLTKIDKIIADEGLFLPLLCVAIGMFVRDLKLVKRAIYWYSAFISLFAFVCVKYYVPSKFDSILLMLSLYCFGLIFSTYKNVGKNIKIFQSFSFWGLYLYLYHLIFLRIYNKGLLYFYQYHYKTTKYYDEVWYLPLAIVVSILGPILLAFAMDLFKKSSKNKAILSKILSSLSFILYIFTATILLTSGLYYGNKFKESTKIEAPTMEEYYFGQEHLTGTVSKNTTKVYVLKNGEIVRRGVIVKNRKFKIYVKDLIATNKSTVEIMVQNERGKAIKGNLNINTWSDGILSNVKQTENTTIGKGSNGVKKIELYSNKKLVRTVPIQKDNTFKIYIGDLKKRKGQKFIMIPVSIDNKYGKLHKFTIE